jgi:hypothetical protein
MSSTESVALLPHSSALFWVFRPAFFSFCTKCTQRFNVNGSAQGWLCPGCARSFQQKGS